MKLTKNNKGVYVIRFKDRDGRTHRRTTGQTNRVRAREVVECARIEDIERAALANSLNREVLTTAAAGRRVTIAFAAEQWLEWLGKIGRRPNTLYSYGRTFDQFIRECGPDGSRPVSSITEDHFNSYINDTSKVGKNTRGLRLAVMRSFCEFLAGKGWMTGNPSKLVKVNTRRLLHPQREPRARRIITTEEFDRFQTYLETFIGTARGYNAIPRRENARWWTLASALSFWCGLRLGDVCNLQWDSFTGGELVVWTEKRDVRVAIPLWHPSIGDSRLIHLLELVEVKDGVYLFPEQKERNEDRYRRSGLSKDFTTWFHRAGFKGPGYCFHSLRHSFVTRLAKEGWSLEDIGRVVGHANEETTGIYDHS